jgi:transposase InsO family protein
MGHGPASLRRAAEPGAKTGGPWDVMVSGHQFRTERYRLPRGSCRFALQRSRAVARNFTGHKFLARGYFVSTVGRDEETIRAYIKNQEMRDRELDQLSMRAYATSCSMARFFYTLREAQIIIESWRRHYNAIRPHASLGYKPPAPEVFVAAFAAWPASLREAAPPARLAPRPALN